MQAIGYKCKIKLFGGNDQAFNMQHVFVNEIDEVKWFSTIQLSFLFHFQKCVWVVA